MKDKSKVLKMYGYMFEELQFICYLCTHVRYYNSSSITGWKSHNGHIDPPRP